MAAGMTLPLPARARLGRTRLAAGSTDSDDRRAAVAALIVSNWAYVTTYRLYLDNDRTVRSSAAERFDIEGARVVPNPLARR